MRLPHCAAAVLLLGSLAAHADTIVTYNLTETFYHGSAYGTVTIDSTTGRALAGDVVVDDFGVVEELSGIAAQGANNAVYGIYIGGAISSLYFDLAVPGLTLVGYTGGAFCAINQPIAGCSANGGRSYYVSAVDLRSAPYSDTALTGSLVSSVTPEPSSIALFGTGILGIAGIMRKRFA